jgi:ABC-2 type transport system permease protein
VRNLKVRSFGYVNWLGLWTLSAREMQRFLKVYSQTIIAPVITTLLFVSVFSLVFQERLDAAEKADYITFLIPGLVMMSLIQNAFSNTSFSIMIAKIQGNIVDTLMAPLSSKELMIGYAAGGVARGIIVSIITMGIVVVYKGIDIFSIFWSCYFILAGSIVFSLLGIVAGVWAKKFDHLETFANFLIMPLSFLSGTFYSRDVLPVFWQKVVMFNPFYYLIDGFRYGVVGHSGCPLFVGGVVALVCIIAVSVLCLRMLYTGYELKN